MCCKSIFKLKTALSLVINKTYKLCSACTGDRLVNYVQNRDNGRKYNIELLFLSRVKCDIHRGTKLTVSSSLTRWYFYTQCSIR